MNILLIGGGGREHALAHFLSDSPSVRIVFCAPGNPGMQMISEPAEIDIHDHKAVIAFCNECDIDLVVVGPEAPLANGITDDLQQAGIHVFGPTAKAAQLESSKGFAKDFMARHKIPTAKYKRFVQSEVAEAKTYVEGQKFPLVLKADGLAAGKGVVICKDQDEAISVLDEIFGGKFGDAGNAVVIEEFMKGEEASVFAICDGTDYVVLSPSQDHKAAFDGDKGPNTGGMGAYAPAPVVTDEVMAAVKSDIIEPVLRGMAEEEMPFVGCLYVGLMIKKGQPRVVEFNVRFGDPETQAVLTVLRADLARLFLSAARGEIDKRSMSTEPDGFACTVILASEGYPGSYEKGKVIEGVVEAEVDKDIRVYHAGTAERDGELVTNGGRVLAVTGHGWTLEKAQKRAYRAVEKIDFEGKTYRTDIGHKALKK